MSTPSPSWRREVLRRPRKGDNAPRTVEKFKNVIKSNTCALATLWSALLLEVAFQQHIGGNCFPRCSKCHFMIACADACVANFTLRQRGGQSGGNIRQPPRGPCGHDRV